MAAILAPLEPRLCHIRKFGKKKSDLTDIGHDAQLRRCRVISCHLKFIFQLFCRQKCATLPSTIPSEQRNFSSSTGNSGSSYTCTCSLAGTQLRSSSALLHQQPDTRQANATCHTSVRSTALRLFPAAGIQLTTPSRRIVNAICALSCWSSF